MLFLGTRKNGGEALVLAHAPLPRARKGLLCCAKHITQITQPASKGGRHLNPPGTLDLYSVFCAFRVVARDVWTLGRGSWTSQ